MDIRLVPLTEDDREQFILDIRRLSITELFRNLDAVMIISRKTGKLFPERPSKIQSMQVKHTGSFRTARK